MVGGRCSSPGGERDGTPLARATMDRNSREGAPVPPAPDARDRNRPWRRRSSSVTVLFDCPDGSFRLACARGTPVHDQYRSASTSTGSHVATSGDGGRSVTVGFADAKILNIRCPASPALDGHCHVVSRPICGVLHMKAGSHNG
jgi:hypothetical protein